MKQVIYLLLFTPLFYACSDNKATITKGKNKPTPVTQTNEVTLTAQQIKSAGIEIDTPQQRNMHTTLRVNGVVDVPPQNIVSVTFPLGGYLKTMNLLPGMQVRKGQVLATLEDPQYIQVQQDYLMAKSKLKFLEADYKRQRELNETKANSDKVFQQVSSDYESQKVLVRSLSEKLGLININANSLTENKITRNAFIYAPISGYISKVNVNKGRYVSPTDVLFELINPADIHLSLTVFEKDVLHLTPGQKVICYSNNSPVKYEAKVLLISRDIDDERASEVHCHFENYYPQLRPGMYMNAEIEVNDKKVKAVPEEALVRWENKHYVFTTVRGGSFEMVSVEPGATNDGFTEIVQPVTLGPIATKNAYALLMKLKNSEEE